MSRRSQEIERATNIKRRRGLTKIKFNAASLSSRRQIVSGGRAIRPENHSLLGEEDAICYLGSIFFLIYLSVFPDENRRSSGRSSFKFRICNLHSDSPNFTLAKHTGGLPTVVLSSPTNDMLEFCPQAIWLIPGHTG